MSNLGGVSASSFGVLQSIVLDASGGFYVADWNACVLYFPYNSTSASVYGQPSFTASGINSGGSITSGSMGLPWGVTLDYAGNLYVADASNNRILTYAAGTTTIIKVYGQG